MAKLMHPVLFSQHFKIRPKVLEAAGLLDPILNSDTKLFIDPLLIAKSGNRLVKKDALKALRKGFSDVIRLVDLSQAETDASWKAAYKALDLSEASETGLGYGGASRSGNSRPKHVRTTILRTAKEIITLGEKDPDMIPLMGVFEEGVGPDTLSDMTTNLILPVLCRLTEEFSVAHSLPTHSFGDRYGSAKLPENPYDREKPILLVPRDILRDLPFATDWSDVSRAVMEVDDIRNAVNAMFGNFAKATVKERKAAFRRAILSSQQTVREAIDAIASASDSYDAMADLDGFYTFRAILHSDVSKFKGKVAAPAVKDAGNLQKTVEAIIAEFKHLVEDNNLWELLWFMHQPRHERASQLLFFAVATVICAVNNIDISPETNSGGGPVDFKFSKGFRGRLLVELKLSKGSVVHGYTRQLEAYKKASSTDAAIMVIMDVGGMGRKLRNIQKVQASLRAAGERASDIYVIDARRRASASKA